MSRMIGWIVTCLLVVALDGCHVATRATARASSLSAGEATAAALNARFDDTRMSCEADRPAYFCNGVLIRVAGATTSYHAWNPNPGSGITSVPFSYLRKDVGSRILYGAGSDRTQGFIFREASHYGHDGIAAIDVNCVFPYDGITGATRAPDGCQASQPQFPPSNGPCLSQGITTVEAWLAHFRSVTKFPARFAHQCAWGGDRHSFELALRSRVDWEQEPDFMQHMEVMLSKWAQDIPTSLPLEAIFYASQNTARQEIGDGLAGARFIQADFKQATGRSVPIVRLDVDAASPPFSFHDEDQGPTYALGASEMARTP